MLLHQPILLRSPAPYLVVGRQLPIWCGGYYCNFVILKYNILKIILLYIFIKKN